MLLSIIVPIYNVEKYLVKCLNSLLDQSIDADNYEIICINDGSLDNSLAILKRYQKLSNVINVISIENSGVSVARNVGLNIAEGKYITFVDPDDFIQNDSLLGILEYGEQFNLDIIYLKIDSFSEIPNVQPPEIKLEGEHGVVFKGLNHPRRTFPATMYKKSIIGDIRFIPNIIRGQDTVFNAMVHIKAERVSVYDKPYYNYLVRSGSSKQHIRSEKTLKSNFLAITSLLEYQKTNRYTDIASNLYFEEIILLFIQRSMEWIVLPLKSKKYYNLLIDFIQEHNLDHIKVRAKKLFPGFGLNYFCYRFFVFYTKYLNVIKAKLSKK